MSAHISTTGSLTHITLHVFGQLGTVLHVLVLYKLKHDVALGRIGVVSAIGLLVVLLQVDHSVLALSHLQVLHHARFLTRSAAST